MATTSERPVLKICDSCWDARDSPIDQHGCRKTLVGYWTSGRDGISVWIRGMPNSNAYWLTYSCDCPCREEKHSDLATIDLDHDLGFRGLTSQFGEEE